MNPRDFDDVQSIVNGIFDLDISEEACMRQITHLLRDYPSEVIIGFITNRVFCQKKEIDAMDKLILKLKAKKTFTE